MARLMRLPRFVNQALKTTADHHQRKMTRKKLGLCLICGADSQGERYCEPCRINEMAAP